MTVPPRFVGAWRRLGLGLDSGPVEPAGDVVWLQAETLFADLRVGPIETRAFAGSASWSPPEMTWRHELHVPSVGAVPPGPDVATVEGEGNDLIERGTWVRNGRREHYVEHWQRIGDPGPVLALSASEARFLQVGDHALLVTPAGSCRWTAARGGWAIAVTLGDIDAPELPRRGAHWRSWEAV